MGVAESAATVRHRPTGGSDERRARLQELPSGRGHRCQRVGGKRAPTVEGAVAVALVGGDERAGVGRQVQTQRRDRVRATPLGELDGPATSQAPIAAANGWTNASGEGVAVCATGTSRRARGSHEAASRRRSAGGGGLSGLGRGRTSPIHNTPPVAPQREDLRCARRPSRRRRAHRARSGTPARSNAAPPVGEADRAHRRPAAKPMTSDQAGTRLQQVTDQRRVPGRPAANAASSRSGLHASAAQDQCRDRLGTRCQNATPSDPARDPRAHQPQRHLGASGTWSVARVCGRAAWGLVGSRGLPQGRHR